MRLALISLALVLVLAVSQNIARPVAAAHVRDSAVKALTLQASDVPSKFGKFKVTVAKSLSALSTLKLSKKEAAVAAKEGLSDGVFSEMTSKNKASFGIIVDAVYIFKNSDGARWLMGTAKKSVSKSLKTPLKPVSGIGDSAYGLPSAKKESGKSSSCEAGSLPSLLPNPSA